MKAKEEYPETTLYFGCRYEEGDFIYKKQITEWIDSKVIDQFKPAFSRQTAEVTILLLRQSTFRIC